MRKTNKPQYAALTANPYLTPQEVVRLYASRCIWLFAKDKPTPFYALEFRGPDFAKDAGLDDKLARQILKRMLDRGVLYLSPSYETGTLEEAQTRYIYRESRLSLSAGAIASFYLDYGVTPVAGTLYETYLNLQRWLPQERFVSLVFETLNIHPVPEASPILEAAQDSLVMWEYAYSLLPDTSERLEFYIRSLRLHLHLLKVSKVTENGLPVILPSAITKAIAMRPGDH